VRSFPAISLSNSACFFAAAASASAFLLAELDDAEARETDERWDLCETCDDASPRRLAALAMKQWACSSLPYSLVSLASSL
jgi:hypothetical protein